MTSPAAQDVRRTFGLVGVPTSAGSHNAGQERAPAAWREHGLVDALGRAGAQVTDHGDLAVRTHRPSPRVEGVRDADRVRATCLEVADAVARVAGAGEVPLVLGGDCTTTLGVVAGLRRTGRVGLLYLDGDVDLNRPELSGSGVLDTMGTTHLLGGGSAALADLGQDGPLLRPEEVELFGFDPAELDEQQWTTLTRLRLSATPAPEVRDDPAGSASTAWSRLARAADRVVLHVDVDVLDTGAFPLANFPHFNGLALDELSVCLRTLAQGVGLAAVVVTEVNPSHDPDGSLLSALRDVLVAALA
ncbi:arginase family protein [Microlunatus flavus]|uniref:Arginase n=1 Tax=Microlunatus flavus TaxID=1036181 RepID=A0A1H9AWU9_9ACTN|nr:arginase family protein [Microlunatus flavus]SEP81240.1 arginase [Microlunatus flavus]